jgi:hypothetical protein
MRATFALAFFLVASSFSGLACEKCVSYPERVVKRRTLGDLQYQIGADVMTHDVELLDTEAFNLAAGDGGSFPPGKLSFRVPVGGDRQASGSPPSLLVTIVINDVSPGASEIELDDQRAQVSARPSGVADMPYHDVTGHLSIRELAQDCLQTCPARADGTLDVFAVGPNGETLSFTSVTFSAADEVRDGMCVYQGD